MFQDRRCRYRDSVAFAGVELASAAVDQFEIAGLIEIQSLAVGGTGDWQQRIGDVLAVAPPCLIGEKAASAVDGS